MCTPTADSAQAAESSQITRSATGRIQFNANDFETLQSPGATSNATNARLMAVHPVHTAGTAHNENRAAEIEPGRPERCVELSCD